MTSARRWGCRGRGGGADVFGAGTDEAVVVVLLDDVGGPAGDAADWRGWGVKRSMFDAEGGVGGGGVEVDVGVELLLLLDEELDLARHIEPFGAACGAAELFGHAAEVRGARVFGVVDAVAEAGDFFLLGEHLADVLDGVGTGFVDGVEEAHGGLVGSAVEGTFEGSDGTGDSGVDVGEGGGDDARGEGAGVELVVGVEDERDVEGSGGGLGGLFAVEHPEEVGSVREGGISIDDGLTFADAVEDGDDHGDLGCQAEGLADVGVVGAVGLVGVVDAEERDGGAEDLHGRRVGGDAAEEVDDLGIELAGCGEMRGEFSELGCVGEFAEPEKVGGLLECGALGCSWMSMPR